MIRDHIKLHSSAVRRSRKATPPERRRSWPLYALAYAILCCCAAGVIWSVNSAIVIAAPAILLLVVALTVTVAFACGGQAYVHDRFSTHDFVQHNEVGGFIINVAGTLFAVLLGFVTVIAWQHFADARQLVALESAAATDVWHSAVGIPQPQRGRVRRDTLEYANSMVRKEWPKMRAGRFDMRADYVVMDAMTAAGAFKPTDLMQSNSQSQTMQQLSVLHDLRQRRLAENASGISGFEWLVLILSAVSIVSFCWLFGLTNRRIHLVMTATVAILTTSVLVLLFELQFPFRSDLRIAPDSWNASISHIYMMQSGPQAGMHMQ